MLLSGDFKSCETMWAKSFNSLLLFFKFLSKISFSFAALSFSLRITAFFNWVAAKPAMVCNVLRWSVLKKYFWECSESITPIISLLAIIGTAISEKRTLSKVLF